jgi:hypothetical protein
MLDLTSLQSAFLACNPHLIPIATLAGYGVETLVIDSLVTPEGNHPVYILTESCFVQSVDYWQDHNGYDNPTWLVAGNYDQLPEDIGDCTVFMVNARTEKLARDYITCHHPNFIIVDCRIDPY